MGIVGPSQGTGGSGSYDPSNVAITGGTIDGTVIGGTTTAAGSFTTLSASTSISGTLSTAAQPNITSVGTLSGLSVGGDINATTSNLDLNSQNGGVVSITSLDGGGGTNSKVELDGSVGDIYLQTATANVTIEANGDVTFNGSRTISSASSVGTTTVNGGSSGWLASDSVKDQTTASAANVFVSSTNGRLLRSTSAAKYKTDIEPLDFSYAENFLNNCDPIWYRSVCQNDNGEWSWYGFLADDVATVEPRLVNYGENGAVEGFAYDRVAAMHHPIIKDNRKRVEELEAKVASLEDKILAAGI